MTALRDDDPHFRVDELREDLRGRTVRGGAVTVAAQAARYLLYLAGTMVLARLLTPADFGLVAMVMSVVGFLLVFRDLGLITATVQREEIDQAKVSTLFWVNSIFGLLLALIAAAAAPLISRFFDEPRLTPVTVVIGGLTVLQGLGAQHYALLRRKMRFAAVGVAEVLAAFAGVFSAVLFALKGFGYWALVVQQAATALVRMILFWTLCDWRPSAVFRFAEVRSMVAFGSYLTATRIMRSVARSLDRILLGRFAGPGPVGLYAKALNGLAGPFQRITWPVARLAVPVLSRLVGEPQLYRAYFRQGMEIIAFAGVPAVVLLFLEAEAAVLVVLGEQWTGAIPIFRSLAPVALTVLFQMGIGWAYVSSARVATQLRWETMQSITAVSAFVVGVHWGPLGVAVGYSAASVLLVVPSVFYCFRGSPLEARDLFGPFGMPAAASLFGGLAVCVWKEIGPAETNPLAGLAISASVFGLFYLAGWALTRPGRATLRRLSRLVRDVRRPSKRL